MSQRSQRRRVWFAHWISQLQKRDVRYDRRQRSIDLKLERNNLGSKEIEWSLESWFLEREAYPGKLIEWKRWDGGYSKCCK